MGGAMRNEDVANAILDADDLPREKVKTDEWAPFGVPFVFVRGLTAAERDEWESSVTVLGRDGNRRPDPKLKNARARFAGLVMVHETGERIFTEEQIIGTKDRKGLKDKSAVVLERVAKVGVRLSGMLDEEENPSTGDQAESPSSD